MKELIHVGYWKCYYKPDLPDPHDFIDKSWDHKEKSLIIKFLKNGKVKDAWMGSSECRICGIRNGSECLINGNYVYPSGYVHYIEEHNVKPPQQFIDSVLKKTL